MKFHVRVLLKLMGQNCFAYNLCVTVEISNRPYSSFETVFVNVKQASEIECCKVNFVLIQDRKFSRNKRCYVTKLKRSFHGPVLTCNL